MPEKFEPGKRYVVRKELIETDAPTYDIYDICFWDGSWNDPDGWPNQIDGKEVEVVNPILGKVDVYIVNPEWCEEIKEDEAK